MRRIAICWLIKAPGCAIKLTSRNHNFRLTLTRNARDLHFQVYQVYTVLFQLWVWMNTCVAAKSILVYLHEDQRNGPKKISGSTMHRCERWSSKYNANSDIFWLRGASVQSPSFRGLLIRQLDVTFRIRLNIAYSKK